MPARAVAQGLEQRLRVRLRITEEARALHAVLWETMREQDALVFDAETLVSQYPAMSNTQAIEPIAQRRMRTVVAVAAPETSLDGLQFDAYDPVPEIRRVRQALSPRQPTVIESGSVSLANLIGELRRGCDVLYLVCHGFLDAGEPQILLESPSGAAERVSGRDLASGFASLDRVPRLVILVSCSSAGDLERHGDVMATLGPRLAGTGVAAVMAMRGSVSMDTIGVFMPAFFRELVLNDGQVDLATARAREAARDHDWWSPTLFMRLRSGRLWKGSRVGRVGGRFEQLSSLLDDVNDHKFTPILGPGLTDAVLGSRHQIAQDWAEDFEYPMVTRASDDLPQVAQFLAINQGKPDKPRIQLAHYLRNELWANYGAGLPYRSEKDLAKFSLGRLVRECYELHYSDLKQIDSQIEDPHALLAELPAAVYVTTQPWTLMADAIRARGGRPQVETFPWRRIDPEASSAEVAEQQRLANEVPAWDVWEGPAELRREIEEAGWPLSVFDVDPDYVPSVSEPLVYHLFGHIARPPTIVMAEDDYFDFLIAASRDAEGEGMLERVRTAFSNTALVFLGFRLDEWAFRVLFRHIARIEGRRPQRHTSVAVQIDPENAPEQSLSRARDYLEQYMQSSSITIFWGSAEDFIAELRDAWRRG